MESDLAILKATRPATGVTTRPASPLALPPSVIVVGASTGGPQALTALVAGLVGSGPTPPVCVTLHMPAALMPVIASHVARTCGIETCIVTEPCGLVAGKIYFSAGDRHLAFHRVSSFAVELRPISGPKHQFCQPAVDVMFASAAKCLGARTLGVVLSGMGKDGLAGSRAIVAAGGSVLVQDKLSSAVWGMPGAIAKADLAAAVLPPHVLATEIARRVSQGWRL